MAAPASAPNSSPNLLSSSLACDGSPWNRSDLYEELPEAINEVSPPLMPAASFAEEIVLAELKLRASRSGLIVENG